MGSVLKRENLLLNALIAFVVLISATTLESFGDAVVRIGLFNRSGVAQATTLLGGGILLFGYGALLNFAPVPFERVVGLYIATLFCVWQVVAFATFRTVPTMPVMLGGLLIVVGGLVVTFWQR
jgi:small multidrug resistance family-3 protein